MASYAGDIGSAASKRRRTYNTRLIRRTFSYTIHELAELFDLHPNAIRRWVKAGLATIDDRKPHLVHGSVLIEYLHERQRGRKRRCAGDEMFCCRCRLPRRPTGRRVVVERVNARQIVIRGTCEVCGARMNRGASLARLPEVGQLFAVTAAPPRLGETLDPLVKCYFPQGPWR